MLYNDLKGLKFVSINTNSLNLSSRQSLINSLNLFNQKLEGILSLNADIICLQDVRLGVDGKQILQKSLDFNKYSRYKLYVNSSSNNNNNNNKNWIWSYPHVDRQPDRR